MQAKQYLRKWFITTLAMLAGFAAFNVIVDPYGLWDTPRIAKFNELKPQATTRKRIVKPYRVARLRPKTVIVGNSRPDMGLDPASSCWDPDRRPVFNLALPGSSTPTQLLLAAHAIETAGASYVLAGVDFREYLVARSSADAVPKIPRVFPGSERLVVVNFSEHNPDRWKETVKDYASATLSLDALKDSLSTIYKQRDPFADDVNRHGFYSAAVVRGVVHYEGQAVLFRQKLDQLESLFVPGRYALDYDVGSASIAFQVLEMYLKYAQSKNVETVLFINPLHADYLDAIYNNGYWELFEQWKQRVTDIAAQHAVRLLDFSGYDGFSTSTETEKQGGAEVLRWYWEPSHYRSELGEKMIQAIDTQCTSDHEERTFGRELTPSNLHEHLADIRALRSTYWQKKRASGRD